MKHISCEKMDSLLRAIGYSEQEIAEAKKRCLSEDEMDKLVIKSITDYFNANYVDLGLPSGTLWSRKNTNACCIEDYGNSADYLNSDIPHDRIFNLNIQLDMPTVDQMKELLEYTKHEFEKINGCTYWKLTSRINDEYIRLPVGVDYIENGKRFTQTDVSHYWTSTEDQDDGHCAIALAVDNASELDLVSLNIKTQAYLRPVIKKR